jgi:hypothetical protein
MTGIMLPAGSERARLHQEESHMSGKTGKEGTGTSARRRDSRKGTQNLQGQTRGQFERDPKRRRGQYTGAGNSGLTKK